LSVLATAALTGVLNHGINTNKTFILGGKIIASRLAATPFFII
jgi:hypothetical protein